MDSHKLLSEAILEASERISDIIAAGRQIHDFEERYSWARNNPAIRTLRTYLMSEIEIEVTAISQQSKRCSEDSNNLEELPF